MSELTSKLELLSLVIAISGIALLIAVAAIAIHFFYTYQIPQNFSHASLEETFGYILMTLAEIAVRLGFLGIAAWVGAIMLRHGLSSYRAEAKSGEPKKEAT